MEDDFNLKLNERKPDFLGNWEMTSILYFYYTLLQLFLHHQITSCGPFIRNYKAGQHKLLTYLGRLMTMSTLVNMGSKALLGLSGKSTSFL
jgi:hypothetical protein